MNSKTFMRKIAEIGGRNGTGLAKIRGDSNWYSQLSKKRNCCLHPKKKKRKLGT